MAGPEIAVVGAGRWGTAIVRDLVDLGVRPVVVDPALDDALDDIDQLGRVDGIIVATPATTHADVLRSLADRGVPVFCEKPLTTDVATAREAIERFGDRLHVMHVWRYHPGIELLRDLARSGDLGDVQVLRTTRTGWTSPRRDVDPIWTLLPHDLTIAIEILGSIPPPRAATAEWLDEEAVGLWAQCGGAPGAPALFADVSTRFADKRREVRVHGSLGVAVLAGADATEVRLSIGDGTSSEPVERTIPFAGDPPLRRELAAFVDHLAGGPPPRSDAAEGLRVVEAVAELRSLAGLVR